MLRYKTRHFPGTRSLLLVSLMVGAIAGFSPLSVGTDSSSAAASHATSTIIPRTTCPAFPADNVWNTSIASLPVNVHSSQWLATMKVSSSNLHPDYGPSGDPKRPYGIPWTIVSSTTSMTHIAFLYASESDRGLYPLSSSTPIENGSDRHAVMVDPFSTATSKSCTLFETYDTFYRAAGRSTAGSGAIWNLRSDALRPAGFTSADAAGLPIFPGLVNYDEVAGGSMRHAIRFTVNCTSRSFLWPARHQAGSSTAGCPPMGARFRLKSNFSLTSSRCQAFCQTVISTMKNYGLILADNGSNWFFQGTADSRWTSTEVDELKQIPASQFVAVDESCLIVNANSAQALQPGSAAYAARCR